jgi:outer membrane protein assembly factor BamB
MIKKRKIAASAGVLILLCFAIAGAVAFFSMRGGSEKDPALVKKEEPPAPPADLSEWNTYHGDCGLTGVADASFPDALEVSWRFKADAPVRQTPVVRGGRIFFANSKGVVFACDMNGGLLWRHELLTGEQRNGEPVRERVEAPIACFDEFVLAGTEEGVVYALNAATGEEKWRTELDGPVLGTVNRIVVADGAANSVRYVVIGKGVGTLHCLDAETGKILWKGEQTDRCDGSPSVSSDAIAFGSCAAAMHIFDPSSGKKLFNVEIDPDSQIAGGVAIEDGMAYSGCRSGKILRVDLKQGKIVWVNPLAKGEIFSTPALAKDLVVACSDDGNVYALERADGKLRWKFDTKGMPSSPVIAGDKVLVAADGVLRMLSLLDGAERWSMKISDDIASPSVTKKFVLIGSEDGTVVALRGLEKTEGAPQK